MKMHLLRKRNDRIQSVHISTSVIECCTVVERLVDLHRVDHYVPWSSQHDIYLEDQVRERMLEETTVVSGFGGRGSGRDADTDRDSRS